MVNAFDRVELFYLSPNPYGGWVTFTAHLVRALAAASIHAELFKVKPITNENQKSDGPQRLRDFGYRLFYRNLNLDDAKAQRGVPKLIVAAAKKYRLETSALLAEGAHIVVHDPTELKNLPPLNPQKTIVIRRAGLRYINGATFIRHPFQRQCSSVVGMGEMGIPDKKITAVSTARIDFDKHTDIILDANKLLPPEHQIQIHGFENNPYGFHSLVKKHTDWMEMRKGKKFERTMTAASQILMPARLSVDMSEIKGDGGGTQYCFLEAWDAGAVPVINRAWVDDFHDDDMKPGINCIAVKDGAELADRVTTIGCRIDSAKWVLTQLAHGGLRQLELHRPEVIGHQYKEALGWK